MVGEGKSSCFEKSCTDAIITFMKLTTKILKEMVISEKKSMLDEKRLRENVRGHVKHLLEAGPKTGGATAEVEGSVDIKKMADALGADPGKLKTAVTNLRAGKRNSNDNAVFGDIFAKLLEASPEDTVKAMNVLKKVSAEDGGEEKKK